MASIPINNLPIINVNNINGLETVPLVKNEGGNYFTYRAPLTSFFYDGSVSRTGILANGIITPAKLTTGAPVWNQEGILTSSNNIVVRRPDANAVINITNTTTPTVTPRYPQLIVTNYSGGTNGHPAITTNNARGTESTPAAVQQYDLLTAIVGSGYNGSQFVQSSRIEFQATDSFTNTKTSSRMLFKITPDNRTGLRDVMTVDQYGAVFHGISSIATRLWLGIGRSADGPAHIDLCGDPTTPNYGVRLIRNAGVNASSLLTHRGTGDLRINAEDAADVKIKTFGTDRVVINSIGRVGIGTGSPTTTLHTSVSGNLDGIFNNSENGWMRYMPGTVASGSFNPITQAGDSTIIFSTGSIGTGNFTIAPWSNSTAGLRMLASGDIGIGTSTPGSKLDVNGIIRSKDELRVIGSGSTTSKIDIGFQRSANGVAVLNLIGDTTYTEFGCQIIRDSGANAQSRIVHRGTGTCSINVQDAGIFAIQTSSLTRMTITPTGNVGIGTPSPSTTLDVAGSVKGQSFNSSSSLRYKENITPMENALDIVTRLEPVRFDWRESKIKDIGLIAEEVDKVLPEFVLKNTDEQPDAIDYGKLTSVLIGAVKELAEKITNK